MRVNLAADPHVVRIMFALRSDRIRVVGALHMLWCAFDQHSTDGSLTYTPAEMDAHIGWEGFTDAVIRAGWLESDGSNVLTMHNFEAHNSASAKRRASEQKRMQSVRNHANDFQTSCPPEKRREENINTSTRSKAKEGASRFTPPSLQEISSYIQQRKSTINPEAFLDFYGSKGWKIGNSPMKDWRAAVRTWERRDKQSQGGQNGKTGNSVSRATERTQRNRANIVTAAERHYGGKHVGAGGGDDGQGATGGRDKPVVQDPRKLLTE